MNSIANQYVRQDDRVACPWCNSRCYGKHWKTGKHFETWRGRKCKSRAEEDGIDFSDPDRTWISKAIILEKTPQDESTKSSKKRTSSGSLLPSSFIESTKFIVPAAGKEPEGLWVAARSVRHHRRHGHRRSNRDAGSSSSSSSESQMEAVRYMRLSSFTSLAAC